MTEATTARAAKAHALLRNACIRLPRSFLPQRESRILENPVFDDHIDSIAQAIFQKSCVLFYTLDQTTDRATANLRFRNLADAVQPGPRAQQEEQGDPDYGVRDVSIAAPVRV